ncbi:invasion associated locus B family protein [Oricola indica]|uniref:invasion associated locus B family protein n=1 Tax=Oricola indica TaxID=2872591 RepID=UPI003CCC1B47
MGVALSITARTSWNSRNHLLAAVLLAFGVSTVVSVKAQQPTATTATYGDWVVRCRANPPAGGSEASQTGSDKICEMATVINVVRQGQGQQTLAQIAIGATSAESENAAGTTMVIQLPIGVSLREDAKVIVDPNPQGDGGTAVIAANYFRCIGQACLAEASLPDEDLQSLRSAETAQLQFVDGADRRVRVAISLNGFGDAASATLKP